MDLGPFVKIITSSLHRALPSPSDLLPKCSVNHQKMWVFLIIFFFCRLRTSKLTERLVPSLSLFPSAFHLSSVLSTDANYLSTPPPDLKAFVHWNNHFLLLPTCTSSCLKPVLRSRPSGSQCLSHPPKTFCLLLPFSLAQLTSHSVLALSLQSQSVLRLLPS